jgi:hypothetical protein
MLIETLFEKILKYQYSILKKKKYFYRNGFLSFYLDIVCKNIVWQCVTWA